MNLLRNPFTPSSDPPKTQQHKLSDTINLLQEPQGDRNKERLESLYFLLKDNAYFSDFWEKMPVESCLALLQRMEYKHIPSAQTICNSEQDFSKEFCLILKGSVYISTPSEKSKHTQPFKLRSSVSPTSIKGVSANSTPKLFTALRSKFIRKKNLFTCDGDGETPEPFLTKKDFAERFPGRTIASILKQGDYFGDATIKQNEGLKNPTVVAREPCHLMVIKYPAYSEVRNKFRKKYEEAMIDFFQTIPTTKNWPFENIMNLAAQATLRVYKKNNVIYDLGDPCDFIYFIKEGEVEIVREKCLDVPYDEVSGKRMSLQQAQLFHMNRLWKNQHANASRKYMKVALLGAMQCFGEEELHGQGEKRETRAVVQSSTAEIYVVSYMEFLENKNNPRELCKKLLNVGQSAKHEWRDRLENKLIGMSLANSPVQKTRSKFHRELMRSVPILITNPSGFSQMLQDKADVNRTTQSSFKHRVITPKADKDKSPSMMRTITRDNDKRSQTHLKKMISIPAKSNRRERSALENSQVTVVFRPKFALDMNLITATACLDISPQSFQGTRIFQDCENSQTHFEEEMEPRKSEFSRTSTSKFGHTTHKSGFATHKSEIMSRNPDVSLTLSLTKNGSFGTSSKQEEFRSGSQSSKEMSDIRTRLNKILGVNEPLISQQGSRFVAKNRMHSFSINTLFPSQKSGKMN